MSFCSNFPESVRGKIPPFLTNRERLMLGHMDKLHAYEENMKNVHNTFVLLFYWCNIFTYHGTYWCDNVPARSFPLACSSYTKTWCRGNLFHLTLSASNILYFYWIFGKYRLDVWNVLKLIINSLKQFSHYYTCLIDDIYRDVTYIPNTAYQYFVEPDNYHPNRSWEPQPKKLKILNANMEKLEEHWIELNSETVQAGNIIDVNRVATKSITLWHTDFS